MRLTNAQVKVAIALLQNTTGRHYGYELSRAAGVRSGVMYPLLRRLLNDKLVVDSWEDPGETDGRPPRRYYTLTTKGVQRLGGLVEAARADKRFAGWNFGGLPGRQGAYVRGSGLTA
jgi:PadR family transcriptional regulator PadR